MRPGRLYIKIFLYFCLVLFITEILIFGLFVFSAGRYFRTRLEQYTSAKVLIAKRYIEDKINTAPHTSPAENAALKDLIRFISVAYGAKLWVSGSDKSIIIKSFEGDMQEEVERLTKKHGRDYGDFRFYHDFRKRGGVYYTVTPVALGKFGTGELHIYFEGLKKNHHEGKFAVGLLIVGVVIAVLIIPISRLITKPIKELTESAHKIGEGDLSHRAGIQRKDEIGDLGRTFNTMAERLERMILGGRELTAHVSHELRSPLARIRVAEELLRQKIEKGDDGDLIRHLDEIREDIGELDDLIGRILLLSKMDIQETPLKKESLNPNELIETLMKKLEQAIGQKGLSVLKSLAFDRLIFADWEVLGTALSNVLENAVKFTPEKGSVTVMTHSEDGFLVIDVTNTCENLSTQELLKILEPFYRAKMGNAIGTGLGLAIAKKIIEKHGGGIEAANVEEGLRIRMRIPVGH